MEKLFVTYKFKPNTTEDLKKFIDFLTKGEQILKQDEDAELDFVCEVDTATIKIGMAKLKPTETYDPNARYDVIPGEHIDLYGVLDLLTEKNEWKRMYPKRPDY
jgi:translation initiation factor 2B subunit (eIF-2B alpha/beta/delta family)